MPASSHVAVECGSGGWATWGGFPVIPDGHRRLHPEEAEPGVAALGISVGVGALSPSPTR
jgi:hypothetical protein